MTEETLYTLFKAKPHIADDDVIIARGLTISQAAKAILECDSTTSFISDHDYGGFRAFELRKYDAKMRSRVLMGATVSATQNAALDREAAERLINIQVIARCKEFSDCSVMPDAEFDRRIQRVIERRASKALEQLIVTQLVDRLLEEGYRITACARRDIPPFRNSRRRDPLLKFLFDLEIADLVVIRKGEESRISLVFDENGWDVIVDFTTDLEYLIDPIVEPFLPWNKPGSKEPGYTIIPLPSPEQLEKGDPEAHNAVDRFFTVMEKTFG